MLLSGHFITAKAGKCFLTQIGELNTNTNSAVLCLPSLFEELNLARAVVAKQAQAFANHGLPCVILDYFGTGDSEGELEYANTDIWLQDVLSAARWLKERGIENIILWGIRFGGLLALAHQKKLHNELNFKAQLLWKPVTSGKQFIGQLLRVKQTNAMLSGSADKINWRNHILDDNNTEVAGYVLTKAIVESIEGLQVSKESSPLAPTVWFELASNQITPASQRIMASWSDASISSYSAECPAFWQVPEVFSLPGLMEQNIAALRAEKLL